MKEEQPDIAEWHWGGCPTCKQPWPKIINYGCAHFAVCEGCQTTHFIGANLFSSWKHESFADWAKNEETLSQCQSVEPYYTSEAE